MRVLLDAAELPPASSIAQGLRAAAETAERNGRIVIEVHADGVPVPEDQIEHLDQREGQISELKLVTADPKSLVRVSFLDAADMLERAIQSQNAAAELLHEARFDDAMRNVGLAVSVWQMVQDVVAKGAAVLGLPLDQIEVVISERATGLEQKAVPITRATEDLSVSLRNFRAAMESEDWSALADVLQFELGAHAETWKSVLRALAEHAAR